MLQQSIESVYNTPAGKRLMEERNFRDTCLSLCLEAEKRAVHNFYKDMCNTIALRVAEGETNISGKFYIKNPVIEEFGCNDFGGMSRLEKIGDEILKSHGLSFTNDCNTEGPVTYYAVFPLIKFQIENTKNKTTIEKLGPSEKWKSFWEELKKTAASDNVILEKAIFEVEQKSYLSDSYFHPLPNNYQQKPEVTEVDIPFENGYSIVQDPYQHTTFYHNPPNSSSLFTLRKGNVKVDKTLRAIIKYRCQL